MNGILLVDKPSGPTSHDLVAQARKILGTKEVGHAGTLDPLATGLMVLLIGQGTKLSDYLMAAEKKYEVLVQLGIQTDSLDITGEVLQKTQVDLTEQQIHNEVYKLQGDFEWEVPMVSAVKVQGKKLYEYARQGQEVAAPKKHMSFYDLKILQTTQDQVRVQMGCTKGSFVRTWSDRLGKNLNVGGVVAELRRTHIGHFTVIDAVNLVTADAEAIKAKILSMSDSLPGWRAALVKGRDAELILNGQIPQGLHSRLVVEQKEAIQKRHSIGIKVLSDELRLLALLEATADDGLRLKRVFRP